MQSPAKDAMSAVVALRKESVDRNAQRRDFKRLGLPSLSARRAWIEIPNVQHAHGVVSVALRKESVDRNINMLLRDSTGCSVALRKESVDRNDFSRLRLGS